MTAMLSLATAKILTLTGAVLLVIHANPLTDAVRHALSVFGFVVIIAVGLGCAAMVAAGLRPPPRSTPPEHMDDLVPRGHMR